MTAIAENIAAIQRQIRQFEQEYGRESGSVSLLAVSKRHSVDAIRQAFQAGITDFGENYLQEAEDKIDLLSDLPCQWHFIGPIQSNKTRSIAEQFSWVHSVDREKIARRLSQQRPQSLPALNICVQVNVSSESSKSGTAMASAASLCRQIASLPRLRLRGLMAIPAPENDFARQREIFRQLGQLHVELNDEIGGLDTLSMGMSGDFQAAIAEGSTMIRLGTALFGPRE